VARVANVILLRQGVVPTIRLQAFHIAAPRGRISTNSEKKGSVRMRSISVRQRVPLGRLFR
jgi:hypothetical protein